MGHRDLEPVRRQGSPSVIASVAKQSIRAPSPPTRRLRRADRQHRACEHVEGPSRGSMGCFASLATTAPSFSIPLFAEDYLELLRSRFGHHTDNTVAPRNWLASPGRNLP